MAARARTIPRKTPVQERSRDTVEAILAATARVLVKEGYEGASTNRIAVAAGVSIGSLYQYFPSKEAVVAAAIERHTQELSQVVLRALLDVSGRPIRTGQAAVLGTGDYLTITADGSQESRSPKLDVIVVGGRPIGQAIAWAGPFVMNTKAEVLQAYEDFRAGEVKDTWCQIEKTKAGFGFDPSTPLEDGLRATWAWFDSHRS